MMGSMTSGVGAIEVTGLSKAYGSQQALRGIDFTVARGEVFGLLGPNGAGKTTTVEVLEGYRPRDGGSATVLGHDPGSGARDFREHIGVVLLCNNSDFVPRMRPMARKILQIAQP